MSSPAANVAADKTRNPGRYCPATRCLWRTGDGTYCPRHSHFAGAAIATEAPAMLDPAWTPAQGYGHAASIAAKLARADDARRATERD